jgi:hypothetical protein
MPENVQMPRFMEEPEFRPTPMPRSLQNRATTGTKLKAPPKKIFFYDQLKKEVTDWIKN